MNFIHKITAMKIEDMPLIKGGKTLTVDTKYNGQFAFEFFGGLTLGKGVKLNERGRHVKPDSVVARISIFKEVEIHRADAVDALKILVKDEHGLTPEWCFCGHGGAANAKR